jgi:hypothetical protein
MNAKANLPDPNSILIRGEHIPVVTQFVAQSTLKFFAENPRIYSVVRPDGGEPNQTDIENKLLEMDHVKALIQDIKRDGGLTDPVVVKLGTLEVLEGNSRLAAYRALAKIDPIKWGLMKCRLLPEDIAPELIFALLGQYHIKGKKDWVPFEQAGFLYRRHKSHDIEPADLAREIGLTKRKVEHLISTYEFMIDHGEADTSRWSFYDEYLKSSQIKKARLKVPNFDNLIVEKIQSGEIARAVDIRDRLPVICAANKPLQKLGSRLLDFEEAHEQAIESGADNTPFKKLSKFRNWLATPEVEVALSRTQGEARNKIEFELNKLATRIEAVRSKMFGKK